MIRRWVMATIMALSTILPFLPAGVAQAAPFGRGQYYGYFTNVQDDQGNKVLSGGVHTYDATSFINYIICKLYGNTFTWTGSAWVCTGGGGNAQDKTGAAFIIMTMMGIPSYYPVHSNPKGPAYDPTVQANWKAAVHYYANNGWVNWHASYDYTQNTYWQGDGGGGPDPDDDAWYDETGSTGADGAIIFHKPGTGYYILKKACANPLGDLNGLAQPIWSLDASLTPQAPAPAFNGTVQPGQTISLTPSVWNTTTVATDPFYMQVGVEPGTDTYITGQTISSSGGYDTAAQYLVGGANCPGGGAIACWKWTYGSGMPASATSTQTGGATFTVGANAGGQNICFELTVSPSDNNTPPNHITDGPFCFHVATVAKLAVIGQNGDVHAGGGLCGGTLTNGSVKGFPSAGSGGDYVVSASAATGINDFVSNRTGTDTLKVGQAGAYAQVCRPDLVAAATAYFNVGVGYSMVPGTDFDVTGKSGVYFFKPVGPISTLTIHGTVNNSLTIVALAGASVKVTGPIMIDGAVHLPRSAPSLGVIADQDISINAAVTRVDAYLFANNTIHTCAEGDNVATRSACQTPTLSVNGFLMAKTILLQRMGPANTNGNYVGEQVALNPQIYLNPPKLFDSSVDNILLEGQGEKQPLF